MQDFRGYTVNDGDMVIVCYAHHPHMDIGVVVDEKVRTLKTINSAKVFRACYWIANPTQAELDLKDEILEKIEENKKAKKARQKELAKHKGDMLGGVYSTTEGSHYIYLGKLKSELLDENGYLLQETEGHCYYRITGVYGNYSSKKLEDVTSDEIFKTRYNYGLSFQKGLKNINGLAGVHSRFSMKDYRDILGEYEFENKIWDKTKQDYVNVKFKRKISLA